MHRLGVALMVGVVGVAGCTAQQETANQEPEQVVLGPVDGHDLAATDLDRVQVGQAAPDFSLVSLAGPPVTLSSYQGMKNVILVFYRGHW